MTRQEIFEIIKKTKIIPAVKIENSDDAIHTAKALAEGGIKIVEFTYRTACAGEAISKVSQNCADILTGAGTITDLKKAKDAVKSGAQFIVMPGFDEKTVDWCIKKNIPVIPGVATPTEIMTCVNKGLKVLKLFPASTLGGIEFLKAVKGPFQDILFIPTGGINSANARTYLELSNVIAVGGSWLTKPEWVKNKEWKRITDEAISSLKN